MEKCEVCCEPIDRCECPDILAPEPEKEIATLRSRIEELEAENERLREALIAAIRVCRDWHGPEAFDIYYNHSPEMRAVRDVVQWDEARAALNGKAEPLAGEE